MFRAPPPGWDRQDGSDLSRAMLSLQRPAGRTGEPAPRHPGTTNPV
ncbi:hypothetical protein FRUB_04747 [Fimbriiglobus ruber]|uniref:Uncharacterized protein n=1 Tax=Fimbriiglobus ruber TaxID=1908690 RepID=A0A225DX07_9BACT|nr:hypothetical protein FRUB_04747 [Fimbriiglobus ruber]